MNCNEVQIKLTPLLSYSLQIFWAELLYKCAFLFNYILNQRYGMKAIYCSDCYSSAVLFILLSKRILTVDQRIYFNRRKWRRKRLVSYICKQASQTCPTMQFNNLFLHKISTSAEFRSLKDVKLWNIGYYVTQHTKSRDMPNCLRITLEVQRVNKL